MLAKAFLLLGLAGAAAFDLTMSKWNDTMIKRPFGNPQPGPYGEPFVTSPGMLLLCGALRFQGIKY
jgi:hypothetical protein